MSGEALGRFAEAGSHEVEHGHELDPRRWDKQPDRPPSTVEEWRHHPIPPGEELPPLKFTGDKPWMTLISVEDFDTTVTSSSLREGRIPDPVLKALAEGKLVVDRSQGVQIEVILSEGDERFLQWGVTKNGIQKVDEGLPVAGTTTLREAVEAQAAIWREQLSGETRVPVTGREHIVFELERYPFVEKSCLGPSEPTSKELITELIEWDRAVYVSPPGEHRVQVVMTGNHTTGNHTLEWWALRDGQAGPSGVMFLPRGIELNTPEGRTVLWEHIEAIKAQVFPGYRTQTEGVEPTPTPSPNPEAPDQDYKRRMKLAWQRALAVLRRSVSGSDNGTMEE